MARVAKVIIFFMFSKSASEILENCFTGPRFAGTLFVVIRLCCVVPWSAKRKLVTVATHKEKTLIFIPKVKKKNVLNIY